MLGFSGLEDKKQHYNTNIAIVNLIPSGSHSRFIDAMETLTGHP